MKSSRKWYPLTGTVSTKGEVAAKALKAGPTDPLTGPKLALAGRVVTMDDNFTVRPDSIVYINQACVVDIRDRTNPHPDFNGVPVVETGVTIFPGLIELHNH
jgi:imidazolonepropionase-like amidohydrolase